jgi:hypothetical protein
MGTNWGTPTKPATVCIAMPVYDQPEHETMRSLRKLHKPNPHGAEGVFGATAYSETNGVLIEAARNAMVSEATSYVPGFTHMLFIDADMIFPSAALKTLLYHDKDIVGGLYFNRRPPYPPILMRANDPSWFSEESLLGHWYDYPREQLVEVDATGCGFMLVKTDVFAHVYSGDPASPGWFDKLPGLSEDYSFCVRAIEKGFKVFVDTHLKLGHVGKVVVDEAYAERNRTGYPLPWRSEPRPGSGGISLLPRPPVMK